MILEESHRSTTMHLFAEQPITVITDKGLHSWQILSLACLYCHTICQESLNASTTEWRMKWYVGKGLFFVCMPEKGGHVATVLCE